MNKHSLVSLILGAWLVCGALPLQAQSTDTQQMQARLARLQQGAAAQAAPQALAEMRGALQALSQLPPQSADYALQKERFENKAREAELRVQAQADTDKLRLLEQQQQALSNTVQVLQARKADLQDRLAHRRQELAQRENLNEELARQRRARLDAESRLARLAQEQQQLDSGLNALLGQLGELRDDASGKHLRMSSAALFGRGATLSAAGQKQVQAFVKLVQLLPARRFSVQVAPETAGGAALAQARAEALRQALVAAGLPAASVGVGMSSDLPAGSSEILIMLLNQG